MSTHSFYRNLSVITYIYRFFTRSLLYSCRVTLVYDYSSLISYKMRFKVILIALISVASCQSTTYTSDSSSVSQHYISTLIYHESSSFVSIYSSTKIDNSSSGTSNSYSSGSLLKISSSWPVIEEDPSFYPTSTLKSPTDSSSSSNIYTTPASPTATSGFDQDFSPELLQACKFQSLYLWCMALGTILFLSISKEWTNAGWDIVEYWTLTLNGQQGILSLGETITQALEISQGNNQTNTKRAPKTPVKKPAKPPKAPSFWDDFVSLYTSMWDTFDKQK